MAKSSKKSTQGNQERKKSTRERGVSQAGPNLTYLQQIFELMASHDMAELEWEGSGQRFHFRTRSSFVAQPIAAAMIPAAPQVQQSKTESKPTVISNDKQRQILSPFVGTFYRAASPTSEPYTKEGQVIKPGDVLCIIEAMKLMNEIESEFHGKIISILVENGQPVEFGEPLFTVETT